MSGLELWPSIVTAWASWGRRERERWTLWVFCTAQQVCACFSVQDAIRSKAVSLNKKMQQRILCGNCIVTLASTCTYIHVYIYVYILCMYINIHTHIVVCYALSVVSCQIAFFWTYCTSCSPFVFYVVMCVHFNIVLSALRYVFHVAPWSLTKHCLVSLWTAYMVEMTIKPLDLT